MSNFGPVISSGLIVKMSGALIKEVRVGIAAARSGMNLQTKFKKKNEQINLILRKYLDYLEDLALNRINERQFKILKHEWKEMIKTKIPKFYRMEAKTIYFNYYELEVIRRNMTEDLQKFISSNIKNLIFATSARVFPYLNQAVSVRIILAKFYKISEEDIEKEHIAEYKADILLREKEIKEEEDSFEDELEELECDNINKKDNNSDEEEVEDNTISANNSKLKEKTYLDTTTNNNTNEKATKKKSFKTPKEN